MPVTRTEKAALSAEKKLAQSIAKLRDAGRKWHATDGTGICEMNGMPKTAIAGRKLLRKHGLDTNAKGSRIAPSYERTDAFKAAASKAAQARKAPAKPARKRTAKKS